MTISLWKSWVYVYRNKNFKLNIRKKKFKIQVLDLLLVYRHFFSLSLFLSFFLSFSYLSLSPCLYLQLVFFLLVTKSLTFSGFHSTTIERLKQDNYESANLKFHVFRVNSGLHFSLLPRFFSSKYYRDVGETAKPCVISDTSAFSPLSSPHTENGVDDTELSEYVGIYCFCCPLPWPLAITVPNPDLFKCVDSMKNILNSKTHVEKPWSWSI